MQGQTKNWRQMSQIKKQGHKAFKCRSKPFNPAEQFVKTIFGWDYNTWCTISFCERYGWGWQGDAREGEDIDECCWYIN